ncbi:metal ABC transporter ATP-binding protein [Porphyromonas loveana]|uniref:Zinc transport system ATP-binding protein n=1 Tax=Porphyromonas loveana TaxID=1884669 RepID=A0A2U1FSN2_9PORP|nr:ATP-binding cassette domain-containing protein [Porphyromonas loveana]PVZ15168.1 zinc transport system ATP-binding protein [Porphyromonas loveana]
MENNRLLSLRSASVGYGNRDVLRDYSLDVARGELLGIVGRNGGGKSTLVKALIGLLPLRTGSLTFYDRQGQPSIRPSIGYLPQLNRIDRAFPIQVGEVIGSGLTGYVGGEEPSVLLQRAATDLQIADLLPRPISDLSGGQLQRVLLARAIVSCPELLILDEPNSYLDESAELLVCEAITQRHKQGATILLISHDRESVGQQANRIISLD